MSKHAIYLEMATQFISQVARQSEPQLNERSREAAKKAGELLNTHPERAYGLIGTFIALGTDVPSIPAEEYQGYILPRSLLDIADEIRHAMRMDWIGGHDEYVKLMDDPSVNYVLNMMAEES